MERGRGFLNRSLGLPTPRWSLYTAPYRQTGDLQQSPFLLWATFLVLPGLISPPFLKKEPLTDQFSYIKMSICSDNGDIWDLRDEEKCEGHLQNDMEPVARKAHPPHSPLWLIAVAVPRVDQL